ncbi:MAG TPA: hypothetical protein VKB88_41135 [Bryobacteraceae bacterium]|nr:hypothetical protein [Bryobacteraceae bacterium]
MKRWIGVISPFPAVAIQGRQIAWMIAAETPLVELLEISPAGQGVTK